MGIYTTKIKPIVEDIGMNLKMNNRSFLRILQEVANEASSKLGFGITDTKNTNFTWVILYWRLEIIKRAEYEDELTIKTWANFSKNLYSIRNFEIYLGDELIARADSKWTLVDVEKHNIIKIPDEMVKKYEPLNETVFEKEYKAKINLPDSVDKSYTYKIMKRDLDANHHVNNISYLDIANEIIPDELINNAKELNIIYKKEIEYGDTIECMYKDNTVYFYNKEKNILHGAILIK